MPSRTYKINFETDVNVQQVCQELATSNAVSTARPNYISRIYATPNDEFYSLQWGLQAIEAEAGWAIETGHPDVIIAIVDSGVDLSHEDLKDKILPSEDFVDYQGTPPLPWYLTPIGDYQNRDFDPDDDNGHGSHCAGIAAAISDNNLGVAGVARVAKFYLSVSCSQFGIILRGEKMELDLILTFCLASSLLLTRELMLLT